MNKKEKERQEKIEYINSIVNRKTNYTKKQEQTIKHFIFNIITSNSVMNRYSSSMYGDVTKNDFIYLTDCIEYLGREIAKENNKC